MCMSKDTCGNQRTTCGILLPLSRFRGLNLCHQPWQQVLLPAEPSHQLHLKKKKIIFTGYLKHHIIEFFFFFFDKPRRLREGMADRLNLKGTPHFVLKN